MLRHLLVSTLCLGSLAAAQEFHGPCDPYFGRPRYANPSSYTIDMVASYGFNAAPDSEYSADMFTAEVGLAYYFTPKQAITLSMACGGGGESHCQWYQDANGNYFPGDTSYDRVEFSLMPGYRFTQPLGRYVSLTLGAKCGLDIQHLLVTEDYGPNAPHYHADGTHFGFGYAGYAELGFLVTPRTRIVVGYQYHGATTKPAAKDDFWGETTKAKDMRWHEVRAGLDVQF